VHYELKIQVDTVGVPVSESIPEILTVNFKCDSRYKTESTQRLLAVAAGSWKEFAKSGEPFINGASITSRETVPFKDRIKKAVKCLCAKYA